MIRLHINIDHVATIRNARGTVYPDPVAAAAICELAGADGITAHLREDRRHIKDDDIARLRAALTTLLNLEMAATDEMRTIAERVGPDVVTLVPERRAELTTEGGLDVLAVRTAIEKVSAMCQKKKIKLSLFIAPDAAHVRLSRELGASQVEFHTGEYCHKHGEARSHELERLKSACTLAHGLGLEVAAGHGLTRANVLDISAIPELVELNIGHSVIADAVLIGMDRAVRDLRSAIDRGLSRRAAARS
jgi:pyridoxine 5-phosphate synthase